MRLTNPAVTAVRTRREVYESLLPLANAHVLELGCGAAETTREIATSAPGVSITAMEVDLVQHRKNLAIADLPNVTFRPGGAEWIAEGDERFDIVLMFKSLHHVPLKKMDQALVEIARVLKPGGLAYFEEPVFDGDYNEIMRLFHDEGFVRAAAFEALERAVRSGRMALVTEKFFLTPKRFRDWAHFEKKILEETHTEHRPTPEQWAEAKDRFMRAMTADGAVFMAPMRVDVLRKRRTAGF
jgi:ubiquinone/menaquinone biosynthesis C-methylase UbiE